ncbi:MAG TPA: S16 family serine protease, partial [Anaeromyxobacter sp.]|nr:S16 family serine protease [Anaeromyxobacter sp.]
DRHAAGAGRSLVSAADVRAAVDAQERRAGRLRERVLEELLRGTLVIETGGARVGQVNGLSVVALGRHAFGRPSRITARVRLGRGEVVDIEREVELGGPIHSKGVLILAGFLGGRYCRELPLTLAATLVFEQSYSGIEGDSASSAELYALLSAIAEVPIRQSLAVTGSVDQLGRVQAVGGVAHKIEGFFDLCRARGLTGEEGVLVPAANAAGLVLRDDVVAAASERRFRIFPVETIDDGIELLTGLPAGAADADGRFPDGTFNGRVAARLEALTAWARAFAGIGRDAQEPPHG